MPYVNIKLVKGQASPEQKQKIAEGLTELIVAVMGRDRELTVITVDELATDQWVIGGKQLSRMSSDQRIVSFVNIKVSKGTASSEEMSAMMEAVKNLMTEVLGGSDETNYFIIDELNPDAWGYDGISMSDRARMN